MDLLTNNKKQIKFLIAIKDTMGFEPTVFKKYNNFQNYHFKPAQSHILFFYFTQILSQSY